MKKKFDIIKKGFAVYVAGIQGLGFSLNTRRSKDGENLSIRISEEGGLKVKGSITDINEFGNQVEALVQELIRLRASAGRPIEKKTFGPQ